MLTFDGTINRLSYGKKANCWELPHDWRIVIDASTAIWHSDGDTLTGDNGLILLLCTESGHIYFYPGTDVTNSNGMGSLICILK